MQLVEAELMKTHITSSRFSAGAAQKVRAVTDLYWKVMTKIPTTNFEVATTNVTR